MTVSTPNFASRAWPFKKAILYTFFANLRVDRPHAVKELDRYVDAFLSGNEDRVRVQLNASDKALLENINRYLKGVDRRLDLAEAAFPAIVWLRLALNFWLQYGSASHICLSNYGKWRRARWQSRQLSLVMPDGVYRNVKSGEFAWEDIESRSDCYAVDLFLQDTDLPEGWLHVPWRVMLVAPDDGDAVLPDGPKATRADRPKRSYEDSVGAGVYERAKDAFEEIAQSGVLGRKFSRTVDSQTGKYLYEGPRIELFWALKRKKLSFSRSESVSLKVISRFVECRKASVRGRQ